MIKQLFHNQKLEKSDDKYIYENHFKAELTEEDVKNNVNNIKNNIETLSKMISELDIEKKLQEESKKFDDNFHMKKEAYENYDKYFEENIIEMKRNRTRDKLSIKKFLDNAEEIKQKLMEKHKTSLLNMKETYEFQLKNEYENIKVYDGLKN